MDATVDATMDATINAPISSFTVIATGTNIDNSMNASLIAINAIRSFEYLPYTDRYGRVYKAS